MTRLQARTPSSTLRNAAQSLLLLCLLAASFSLVAAHGSGHDDDEDSIPLAEECNATGVDNWNRGLQIGAIFIIMSVAGTGVFTPIISRYVSWFKFSSTVVDIGKYFGAGVIIATALIHMLNEATEHFGDPCIGDRLGGYEGWSFCIAMLAIFAMHLMETLLHSHAAKCAARKTAHPPSFDGNPEDGNIKAAQSTTSVNHSTPAPTYDAGVEHAHHDHTTTPNCHTHGISFITDDSEQARLHVSTLVLEVGIALHSVIIGMSLAVSSGSSFKSLLAALCFHQFFEGVALGSRLSSLKYKKHAFMFASINAAFFMFSTPLGQIIGIGIRESYAPRSSASLLTQGVLDSLSAGILLYSGIVNFLVEEFSSSAFRNGSKVYKLSRFASMYLGAALMALIGKWA
ncbi:hypothetical protein EV182_003432 [Spiromyces aspiralis]|uniref:Uncharacterized protein n=1 Tax=Spiromyces aspiralis TaxID=68401 RepID=A0ACC1HGX6_9FUNG|nr:hypothetical protein EV182_003432 [Spiromyces aspiralis]